MWTESTIVGTPTDHAKAAFAVYVWGNGSDGSRNVPRRPLPPDTWHTIDLDDSLDQLVWPVDLPADTKAIIVAGIVGTSGSSGVYASVISTFRAVGSTRDEWEYDFPAVSGLPSGAFRECGTVVVPLRHRKFEFWWHAADPNALELYQQFTIQQYFRGGDPVPEPEPPTPVTIAATWSGYSIVATIANGPGHRLDWVALRPVGQDNSIDWRYLNDTKTAPAAGLQGATVTFSPTPGAYTMLLYANDGFKLLATSEPVSVP